MKSLHKLFFLFLLIVSCGYAQTGTTVFVTGEAKEVKKEKKALFGEAARFSNFALSAPMRVNTEYGTNDPDTGEQSEYWFLPDGLSLHAGIGVHTTQTFGLSVNTGIDGMFTPKLAAVPVYAALLLNPTVSDGTSLYFQMGIGHAFALGRGDLSGLYQKYRIGISGEDKVGFFIEVNSYGFGVYDLKNVSTVNFGISLLNFD